MIANYRVFIGVGSDALYIDQRDADYGQAPKRLAESRHADLL